MYLLTKGIFVEIIIPDVPIRPCKSEFFQSFVKSDNIFMPRLNLGSNPEEHKLSDKASSMGKRS